MKLNYTPSTQVIDLQYLIDTYDTDGLPDINVLGVSKSVNENKFNASLLNLFRLVENREVDRFRLLLTPSSRYQTDHYISGWEVVASHVNSSDMSSLITKVSTIVTTMPATEDGLADTFIDYLNGLLTSTQMSSIKSSTLITLRRYLGIRLGLSVQALYIGNYLFKFEGNWVSGYEPTDYMSINDVIEDIFYHDNYSDSEGTYSKLVDEQYLYRVLPYLLGNNEHFIGIQGITSTLRGPQGPRGSAGKLTGSQGAKGIQGYVGIQGANYYSQGVQGYIGYRGIQGSQGIQGTNGLTRSIQATASGGVSTYNDRAIDLVISTFESLFGIKFSLSRVPSKTSYTSTNVIKSKHFEIPKGLTVNGDIYSSSGFYKN